MIYDCIIIGGGPAGLSAAINLVGRGKKPLVISAVHNLLSKAEEVNNYLGIYNVTGKQMMDIFIKHANAQGVEILNKKASNIMQMGEDFYTNIDGEIYQSKSIIIACGVAKAKQIPLENELLGKGVSYCATCDGMLYRNKNAVVWGISQNASEEAEFLHSIGVNVTYVATKCPPSITEKGISFVQGSVKEIEGDTRVTAVKLSDDTVVSADGIFILRDAIAPDKLFAGLQIENGYLTVDRKMQTNIKGCFACGDCTGVPLQVSKAVGEGLVAGLSASEWIDGRKA